MLHNHVREGHTRFNEGALKVFARPGGGGAPSASFELAKISEGARQRCGIFIKIFLRKAFFPVQMTAYSSKYFREFINSRYRNGMQEYHFLLKV